MDVTAHTYPAEQQEILQLLRDAVNAAKQLHAAMDAISFELSQEYASKTAAPVAAPAQPQQSENQEALADTQRAIIEAAERRGYERAIAECGQDRKDAGRYRLLRRGEHWGIINAAGDPLRTDVLDAAIDSVIAAKRARFG